MADVMQGVYVDGSDVEHIVPIKVDENGKFMLSETGAAGVDYENPYVVFRCNSAFTGASVGDTIAGILTINTTTNALVSNTPVWYNYATQQSITVADTSKLTAVASNSLTAAELATMTLAISASSLPLPAGAATQTTLASILAKLISAPATEAKQDALIAKDFATQTTLAAVLALLPTALVNARLAVDSAPSPLTAGTPSAVAVPGTPSTNFTIISANSARKGLCIYNATSGGIAIKYGSTSSTSSLLTVIQPGTAFIMSEMTFYNGRIDGYCSVGSGNVIVTELT